MTTGDLLNRLQQIVEKQPHLSELPAFIDFGEWCDEACEVVVREHPIVDAPGVYIYPRFP